MKKGDLVKVFLKGESPWAKVSAVISPKRIQAEINNHTVCPSLHGLFLGDRALFELKRLKKNLPETWEHVPDPAQNIEIIADGSDRAVPDLIPVIYS